VLPNQITQWKGDCYRAQPKVFAAAADKHGAAPDLKALHAKIGQPALEIDFLASSVASAKQ